MDPPKTPLNVIANFSEAVSGSLHATINLCFYGYDELNIPYYQFRGTPYVTGLIQSATSSWNMEVGGTSMLDTGHTLEKQVSDAATNASEVVTQLTALTRYFHDAFDPKKVAIILSKTDLRDLKKTRNMIGLLYGGKGQLSYDLIDPHSENGVNMVKAREVGYGEAIGCPAAMPPSAECRSYLERECQVANVPIIMLSDFAQTTIRHFKRLVVERLGQIPEEQRHLYIHADDLKILQ